MFLAVSLHPYMYFICRESLYLFGYMVLYFVLLIASITSRHFMHNVTLWCVGMTIVAMKTQQCFPFVGLAYMSLSSLL